MLNSTVEFSFVDEEGKPFTHVGTCVGITETHATITTCYGDMVVPVEELAASTKEVTMVVPAPEQPKQVRRRQKNNGQPSKLEKVISIMEQHPGLSRKEYISMVIDSVDMTPAGASTYVSNAKKRIAA